MCALVQMREREREREREKEKFDEMKKGRYNKREIKK